MEKDNASTLEKTAIQGISKDCGNLKGMCNKF